jgi:PhnB protein
MGGGHIHAEVRIGDSVVMMGQGSESRPSAIYLYVNDADASYKSALKAGAISVSEPVDQPYGDRQGGVKDPSDNIWFIATRKEDLSPQEIRGRFEARAKQQR